MKHQKDKLEKIFGATPFIDVDLIIGYLNNTLNEHDLHTVESALIDDPFLTEAIEGLRELPEEGRTGKIYALLGREPKKQIKLDIPPMVWKIAAVTIVAISSIFFISTLEFKSTEEVAQQIEAPAEEPDKRQSTTVEEISKSNTEIVNKEATTSSDKNEDVEDDKTAAAIVLAELAKEDKATEQKLLKTPEAAGKPKAELLAGNSHAPEMEVVSRSMSADNAVMEMEEHEPSAAKKVAPSPVSQPTRSTNDISKGMIKTLKERGIVEASHGYGTADDKLSTKEKEALAKYDEAIDAYNRGNYHASVKAFEDAYKQDKNLPEIRYYLSTSYLYGNNNVDKAKKVFKNESTGKYAPEKQWVEALIYLGDGKTKNAKETLENISKSGSKFKSEADKLLQEIQE